MATIGSLAVNLTANISNFEKGLKRAQRQLRNFASGFNTFALAVAAPFVGALKIFESTGSQLHDLSEATGISVEKLSFLKYAAEQSSASLENISRAARELQTKGINPDRFEELAASIAKIEDPTQRAQKAFALFGKKAGFPILAMLRDLPKLKKRFQELGGGFTKQMADDADELGDSWGDIKLAVENAAFAIAKTLKPYIVEASKWIADHVSKLRDWVAQHPQLVAGIGKTALVLAAMVPIVWTMTKAIRALAISIALAKLAAMNPLVAIGILAAGLIGYGAYKGGLLKGIGLDPNAPAAAAPAAKDEVAANTATTNDKLDELIAHMRQAFGAGPAPAMAPTIIAPAGVR